MERIYNAICPFCKHDFKVKYLQSNLICEQCQAIIGYHEDSSETMPKPGAFFIFPAGVSYHSMLDGVRVSKRRTKKKLHHMLNGVINWFAGMTLSTGQVITRPTLLIEENPKVRWVGSGNYWCTADINKVEFL